MFFIHRPMDKRKWSIGQWYTHSEDIVTNILSFGMNSCIMYNMPITVPYILLHKGLLLGHILFIFLSLFSTPLLDKIQWKMDIMMQTKPISSSKRSNWFIKRYKNNWKIVKPSIRLGMTSIELIITSKLVIKFGSTLAKNALKVKVKRLSQSRMVLSFELLLGFFSIY
jgi:hypothetical protein